MARKSKIGQEHYEHDPVRRLIRYQNSDNKLTAYTDDAVGNMLSVVKASGYAPSLSSVTPNVIRRGDVKFIALAGKRLQIHTLRMPRSIPAMSGKPHTGFSLR